MLQLGFGGVWRRLVGSVGALGAVGCRSGGVRTV